MEYSQNLILITNHKAMKKLVFVLLAICAIQVSAQIRTVVVDWSDPTRNVDSSGYTIINPNYSVSFLPVNGLSDNLEVFVHHEETIPPIDYRLYNLLVTEGITDSLDSEYTTNRIYLREYDVVARDSAEIFESIEQEENEANLQVFPNEKHLKYLVFYCGIHRRETQGYNVTVNQQAILDKVEAKMENMWMNYINSLTKQEAIRNEEIIDIDSDWVITDPE